MRKIKSTSEIYDFLNCHKLDSLNIIGYIKNHPNECDVWVNDGDVIRGIILYANENRSYMINCYDEAFIQEAVRDLFIGKEVFFSGTRYELGKMLTKYGKTQKNELEYCYLYYYPDKEMTCDDPDVRPLTQADAPVVDFFYTYRNSHSLETIKRDIASRPAVGLEIDGELVAWTLVHPDNSNGMLFVKPHHRRHDYGTRVGKCLCKAVLDRGDIPFVHIVNGNEASVKLTEGLGFVYGYNVIWFDCDFTEASRDML